MQTSTFHGAGLIELTRMQKKHHFHAYSKTTMTPLQLFRIMYHVCTIVWNMKFPLEIYLSITSSYTDSRARVFCVNFLIVSHFDSLHFCVWNNHLNVIHNPVKLYLLCPYQQVQEYIFLWYILRKLTIYDIVI